MRVLRGKSVNGPSTEHLASYRSIAARPKIPLDFINRLTDGKSQSCFGLGGDLFSPLDLLPGSTAYPICRCGPASACGRLPSASSWWPLMPAPWCVTSRASRRKPLPRSSASSLSTRPWRSSSTWGTTTPSTRTTTWTNSPPTRMLDPCLAQVWEKYI